jgi:outer membrane biosynthesis protein TonB
LEWVSVIANERCIARPAFDCRGSVKVAFVKSTKTIDMKYEHTPMHKTVAQLIELLAPPPVAPMVKTPAKKPREPKTPKDPKSKTPRSSKKRAGENGVANGESSQPKRKRKKKDSLAPGAADGAVLPPEMPGALPVGDSSARPLYNAQAGASQSGGSSSYPDGLVNAEEAPASTNGDAHAHSILNLPPGEAARRRDVAIKLLSDNNIDPKSLSAEQFNIFANQSPELQQDSLAMLVKYGAERLRIVHPNKDGSNSGQSTPTKQNAPGPPGGTPQSAKPKKPRKKKADVEGAAASESQGAEAGEGRRRKRICENCRIKKYKGKVRGSFPRSCG